MGKNATVHRRTFDIPVMRHRCVLYSTVSAATSYTTLAQLSRSQQQPYVVTDVSVDFLLTWLSIIPIVK